MFICGCYGKNGEIFPCLEGVRGGGRRGKEGRERGGGKVAVVCVDSCFGRLLAPRQRAGIVMGVFKDCGVLVSVESRRNENEEQRVYTIAVRCNSYVEKKMNK